MKSSAERNTYRYPALSQSKAVSVHDNINAKGESINYVINTKNCSLSIVLTATIKNRKNH